MDVSKLTVMIDVIYLTFIVGLVDNTTYTIISVFATCPRVIFSVILTSSFGIYQVNSCTSSYSTHKKKFFKMPKMSIRSRKSTKDRQYNG